MDFNQIMKQAREMQAKLQSAQEELAKHEIQGTAGGGMVVVTLNGRGELAHIRIDPQVVSDVEMLEDLVTAAFHDAQKQVRELAQRELGGLGGLGGLLGTGS